MIKNPWEERPRPAFPPIVAPQHVIPRYYPSTTKEERKCLQEIRSKGPNIPVTAVLANGMRACDFALAFVIKYHLKKKEKPSGGQ